MLLRHLQSRKSGTVTSGANIQRCATRYQIVGYTQALLQTRNFSIWTRFRIRVTRYMLRGLLDQTTGLIPRNRR